MATADELTKVIESTDMVELVSPYVQLTKQGNNYKGLCPFHNENTPSFVVSPEKHLAHCFGCGKGGNPIRFLMDIKHISFNEALNELAVKNGVVLSNQPKNAVKKDYSKYYKIMQVACLYFEKNLTTTVNGKKTLEYLHKRGLTDELIKKFNIGLAPFGDNLLYKVLKESNYLELDMLDLGLISHNDRGYFDYFTKRITFPITDEFGNIIGFSARLFDSEVKNQPKYINTKDTFLYRKGSVLYNFFSAQASILKKQRVILHEGQIDVIAAYKAGFTESICTMGTALTVEHAKLLKRYTSEAIICYDGDKAGINASLKAIKIFKSLGFGVRLVLLPEGKDPDEYIGTYGCEAYSKYFESHLLSEFDYVFEASLLNKNLDDITVLEDVKKELFAHMHKLNSHTAVVHYLKLLANRLNVSLEALKTDYYATDSNGVSYDEYYDYQAPIALKKTSLKKYEMRLFLYARSSRSLAMEIDLKLADAFDAFDPVNQQLWVTLINNYYANYEEFDDAVFCSLLEPKLKEAYFANIEAMRGSTEVFDHSDLEQIIKKMRHTSLELKNRQYANRINNTNDISDQIALASKVFENKKHILKEKRKK